MHKIVTNRLLLDKITLEDYIDFHAIASSDRITTTFMMTQTANLVETKSIIEGVLEKYKDPNFLFWAVRLRESKKLIGIILAYESRYLELGYAINEDYQNKGYATEALGAVTTYFFTLGTVNEILLGAFTDNYASVRVMEKCGYTLKAIKPHEFFYRGKARDIIYYIKNK